ncbi:hypothetical protein CN567_25970 [Bacillus toyonensis]|nr:hypothetical protein CN567_25970 [Bacillus toyonensis]PFX77876.1 hypothetical protein COL38_24985 [Bacillus toyonensis]PFX99286.1 hypothetical protein COL37_01690 [Bacillus toyonensis]PGB19280.1 hypothetical protein COL98_13870 [Bacillus toyonensis]
MSKVGVCKVDITPPLGIDFIGYHRDKGTNDFNKNVKNESILKKTTQNGLVFYMEFLFTKQVVYWMIIFLHFL